MALGMFTVMGHEYDARLDFRPDYTSRGAGGTAWSTRGKHTLLGTGVRGPHVWEGRPHWEAVQTSKHLDIAWDGSALGFARVPVGPYCMVTGPHMGSIYYMCPTRQYTEARVQEILSHLQPQHVGIELDEPEFWSRGGYGEGFKEEWREYFGEEWRDPESSVEARYQASQLMAHLLQRFVRRVFQAVREVNPQAFCMVNPHSPLSYAECFTSRSMAGDIISIAGEVAPIAEANAVLAEVWSDTIKSAMVCRGTPTIEPFGHSWLDRSLFENLGRGAHKQIFQLLDPKSDDPKFPWASYRSWFEEDTLAALMVGADHFWVAWTDRIMLLDQPPAGAAPAEYRSVFCSVMNVCRQAETHPHRSPARLGVPISDTIMWQRDVPGRNYIDAFYALTLPLLDQGIEVEVLPLECAATPGYLDHFRVLLLSFECWNPQHPEMVEALVRWVREGGTLVYYGASEFDAVPSAWWRRAGHASSRAALFAALGLEETAPENMPLQGLDVAADLQPQLGPRFLAEPLPAPPGWWSVGSLLSAGFFEQPHLWGLAQPGATPLLTTASGQLAAWEMPVGHGRVIWAGLSPWYMAWGLEGPLFLRATAALACARAGLPYVTAPALDVRRGPFRLVYAFSEHLVPGAYVDLLDHRLRAVRDVKLGARQYAMLYDLADAPQPAGLVHSGALARTLAVTGQRLTVTLEGPQDCVLATALRLPGPPTALSVTDDEGGADLLAWSEYDAGAQLLRLGHHSPRTHAALAVEW